MKKITLFLLLSIFFLLACENDLAEVQKLVSADDVQVETMKGVEILFSDSAVVRVRLTGPVMLRHLDPSDIKQEFTEGVEVDFFNNNRKVTGHLTANYGVRMENQAKAIVRDSVVWESVNGDRLETEELIWDERTQKVYTDKFVTITRPDEIIYGYGFEADQDFTYSRIKAVEGTIKIEDLSKEFRN